MISSKTAGRLCMTCSNSPMELFEWINTRLHPQRCTSDRLIYDDMDSQSGRSLPVIYQPFDGSQRSHWCDRGSLFDFLCATRGAGKRLLDFGPGDGWPSLIVAPFAGEVVGVDASRRRVEVCTENAARLGITNARFVFVPPGTPLPFDDNSFDGAMAASSVEQSPDPRTALRELQRVLKPGGRLRMTYEALNGYRNGLERDAWFSRLSGQRCHIILYDRDIEHERVVQYNLVFALSAEALTGQAGGPIELERITLPLLEQVRESIIAARVCTTFHPSGKTLGAWLAEMGFREVIPSHDGSDFAGRLWDALPEERRPRALEAVDALLQPTVQAVIGLAAPLALDPPITAVK
jgi:SAM-dependent methyltransferase